MEMSYFCRAYSITQYGATRQKNRIKGRYSKYQNVDGVEAYFRKLILDNFPGFPQESPTMDERLARFVAEQKGQSSQAGTTRAVSQPTQQDTFEGVNMYESVPNNSGSDQYDKEDTLIFIGFIIGLILFKGVFHWGWIISIVLSFVVGGLFMAFGSRR
jgi:hypothetical protein